MWHEGDGLKGIHVPFSELYIGVEHVIIIQHGVLTICATYRDMVLSSSILGLGF